LYVIGPDGKVWSTFWPVAAGSVGWANWFAIGDKTFPQGSSIGVIHPRSDEGAVSLYAIDSDGKVWSTFWPAAQGSMDWANWFAIRAQTFPQGSPIRVLPPPTRRASDLLYVIGPDGKVWSTFWPAATGSVDWANWFPIGHKTFPQGSSISVIHPRSEEGAVSLYAIDSDGKAWSTFWPAATGSVDWGSWVPIGDKTFPRGAVIRLLHRSCEDGAVSHYAIGSDGKVWSIFWAAAAGSVDWANWFPIGDKTFPRSRVSVIHPRAGEGTVSLYVIGPDGKVWSNFWPAAPGSLVWNGWFAIS